MTVTTITTGGPGTYTVPAGVRWISVELSGCAGENVGTGGFGGRGGVLKVLVRVRPGEVLDYCVGRLGSTVSTDMCRGGAPVANIGARTGGRGGGGTYIARRSYSSSDASNRLRGNLIAVAGGGGGGRAHNAPFGYTITEAHYGGSSIAYNELIARYVRNGAAIGTEAWVKGFIEARGGAVSTFSPDSADYIAQNGAGSVGGRGGQHFNTVQPVLANSFSGADSPYGGGGGGGGYQGGSAGGVARISGEDWGYAGGAGTSWWDPYVSTLYYDSLLGQGNLGSGKVIINDSPDLGTVVQFGDITPVFSYGSGDGSQGGDWGRARVQLRSPIDGLPALDTGFYFVPTEGNRMVLPSGSYVPTVRSDIKVTSSNPNNGYIGSPAGSPAAGESIAISRVMYSSYRPGRLSSDAWLGGSITHEFYTRSALFKGSVKVSPLQQHFTIDGETKSFVSTEFEINYSTAHPPRVSLASPAVGAVMPIPLTSPSAATTFSATVTDPASRGAKSEAFEDAITSYRLDLYEADQATIVKSITTTPPTPIHVPTSGESVSISSSPALTRAEWERVAFWRMSTKDRRGTESIPVAMRPIAMREAPTVQIVAPAPSAVIEGAKPSILLYVTTPNGSNIFSTRYQILSSSFTSVYAVTLNGLVTSHTPAKSVFAGVGSYIIRVTVTDLLGLSATAEIPVTSDYTAPPPVAYSVDASRIEDDGYMEVKWQEAVAAEGFARWNVYRREMPSSSWELLTSIPSAETRVYRDHTAVSGRIYMYSVTQVLVDRGGEVEGVVGVRYVPKTVPDLTNLASHTSPGYNSGNIPNGTLGFTSRAASNGSFDSSVVVNPDAGAPRPVYARNLVTNPSFEQTGTEVTVLSNLVPNPTFRASVTGWSPRGGTLSPADWPHMWAAIRVSGSTRCGQLTSTGISPYLGIEMNLSAPIPVTPGQWIAVSGLVACDSSDNIGCRLDVVCQGSAYTYHSDPTSWAPAPFYAGRKVTWAFQAPETATGFSVRAQMYSGNSSTMIPAGRRLWLGEVHAAVASTEALALTQVQDYVDGSRSPSFGLTYSWTGDPNASMSVAKAFSGGYIRGSSLAWISTAPSESTRYAGSYFGAIKGAAVTLPGNTTFVRPNYIAVPDKLWFAFAGRVRKSAGGSLHTRARAVFYNESNGTTGNVYGQYSLLKGVGNLDDPDMRYIITGVIPEGTTKTLVGFEFAGNAAGTVAPDPGFLAYTDAWQLVTAPTEAEVLARVADYFDGSTPPASGQEVAWEGTPHASSSVLTGPAEHIPGYGGKYMSHKHINTSRPADIGGIFFSPYSQEFADDSTSNTGADGRSNLAVVDASSYTASLYVYNNTDTDLGGYLAIEVYDSSGVAIDSFTARSTERLAATPGWVRVSATTDRLSSSAKFIGVTWVDNSGGASRISGEIFYAGLMVENSELPLANPSVYFNGAKPNDASYNYSWIGSPWVTQSIRQQITMRDEDRTFLISNSNYWLLDPVNPERTIKLPNVKQYDYTEEYERLATNIIGRGRHVDFGDRLGRTGTLVMSLRDPGARSLKREDIFAFVASKSYFILKTPFGEAFPVALGNPAWTQLPGVGSSDMGDLSLPFEEVY